MFKSIALAALLTMVSVKVIALAPLVAVLAVKEGLEVLSKAQDGIGEALDVLDLSDDLLGEFGESDGAVDELSFSVSRHNQELTLLKDDMRSVGYTEEQINDFSNRLNSGQSSLSQKMRALKRTIRSVKKLKSSFQRLFNSKGAEVAVQRGILSTQQQSLHLQMQQMQMQSMRDLDFKKEDIANRRATEAELNKTTKEMAQKKLLQFQSKSGHRPDFRLTSLQKFAAMASVGLFGLGCMGILFGFFREQGLAAIRAASFGFMLSYLLPGIVYLYRSWLRV